MYHAVPSRSKDDATFSVNTGSSSSTSGWSMISSIVASSSRSSSMTIGASPSIVTGSTGSQVSTNKDPVYRQDIHQKITGAATNLSGIKNIIEIIRKIIRKDVSTLVNRSQDLDDVDF
uniref:Uncharacterized protein n=1 Tax=Romanomermis culicivorax TaxID=13658 RepID=A0A915L4Q6_ROMCU